MAGFDLLLVTSVREANSVTVFEALEAGLSVVTSHVSGMKDTIGPFGLTFAPDRADAVETAVGLVLSSDTHGKSRTMSLALLRQMELADLELNELLRKTLG